MRQIKNIVTLLFVLIIISCSHNIGFSEESERYREVTFSYLMPSGIDEDLSTKATDTYFEEGDEVGIFVQKVGESSYVYEYTNVKFIVQAGKLIPATEKDRVFFSVGQAYDICAYHPYRENINGVMFQVVVNSLQTNYSDYKGQDLVSSKILNVAATDITLPFRHQMSVVEIHLKKEQGLKPKYCILNSARNFSQFNLKTEEWILTSDNSPFYNLNLYKETDEYYIYRALLIPQTLGENVVITVDLGEGQSSVAYKLTSALILQSGKKHIINVSVQYRAGGFVYPYSAGVIEGNNIPYYYGETATMTAIPNPGMKFKGWGKAPDYSVIVSTDPVLKYQITDWIVWRAEMEPEICKVRLNFLHEPSNLSIENMLIPESRDYNCGEYIHAAFSYRNPNGSDERYMLQGIYENGNLLSENGVYEFYATHARNITAKYKKQMFVFWSTSTKTEEGTGTFYYNLSEEPVRESFTAYVGEEFDFRCDMLFEPWENTHCNITYLQRKIIIRYNGNIIQTIDKPDTEFFRWIAPYSGNYSLDFVMTGRADVGIGQKYAGGWSIFRNGFRRLP